jgi:GntR family negative regulator for fad regulon and positive regulator of fabA
MVAAVRATRPAAQAERALLRAILKGTYPPQGVLPAERELAGRLGVTRPTLREVLQRLHRDGWLEIRHGKPTRVRDVWREGGLSVLSALVQQGGSLPRELVPELLEVREALAPAYARLAVDRAPARVRELLEPAQDLPDTAAAFATFDWALHRGLAHASGNPIHVLILNGFAGFYETVALDYFAAPAGRRSSRRFYDALRASAEARDPDEASRVTAEAMKSSRAVWRRR